jgi:predicted secreted protein
MKNKKNQQQALTAKFIMTITIIMMIGTLFGAFLYLAQKVPRGLVNENKEFKKIVRNETDSWRVYSDEKYNFIIKYPINISSPNINNNEKAGKKELQKEINFIINNDSKISVYVWDMEASEGNSLAEIKEKYDEVSIGGNYGWQSKQKNDNAGVDTDLSAVYSYETYLYSKDNIYQIEYRGIYGKENFDLYQKMVSSFKVGEETEE